MEPFTSRHLLPSTRQFQIGTLEDQPDLMRILFLSALHDFIFLILTFHIP